MSALRARDFTSAEGNSGWQPGRIADEMYVSADTNRTSSLVLPGPRMQLQTEIMTNGRRYVLKDLFVVHLSYLDENKVFAEHATLPIPGYGETFEEAIESSFRSFDFQWRNLVEVSEDSLTLGGKRRAMALKSVVSDVPELETQRIERRMPSLERDAVESSLKKKGFVVEERDHRYFRLMHDGRYTGIFTKTSRESNHKRLDSGLVNMMAKQLELRSKEFVSLVECPLTQAAYIELLRERGEDF
jgi:hypothetical protein